MLLAAASHNSFKEVHTLIPVPLLLIHFHIIEMRGVSPEAETRLEGRVGKATQGQSHDESRWDGERGEEGR